MTPQYELVANPIVRTVMRYTDEAKNRKGMIVGMPKVTLDCSQVEYICRLATQSPTAARSQAIAECARALRDAYRGDGGTLNDADQGWNDALEHVRAALREIEEGRK